MQKLVYLFCLLSLTTLYAQEWAPIGTRWYYGQGAAFSSYEGYYLLESEKDTVIDEQPCRKIVGDAPTCSHQPSKQFIYEEDSVVYYYERTSEKFQKLYDFNEGVWGWYVWSKDSNGQIDTIEVTVNSSEIFEFSGRTFKKLDVTYTYLDDWTPTDMRYHSTISTYMGDERFFFNVYAISHFTCDIDYSKGLRCYVEPDFETYSTDNSKPCGFVTDFVGGEVLNNVTVYPNPVSDQLNIELQVTNTYDVEILDIYGVMLDAKTGASNFTFDLSTYETGVYMILIKNEEGDIVTTRKIFK